jgi:hypothetical protein
MHVVQQQTAGSFSFMAISFYVLKSSRDAERLCAGDAKQVTTGRLQLQTTDRVSGKFMRTVKTK